MQWLCSCRKYVFAAGHALLVVLQLAMTPSAASTEAVVSKRDGIDTFPAEYFADAQPKTAFDMIAQLPAFSFDAGDDDVRGYAAGSGNVLIDGQRPASKYDGLESVLERIAASSVDRIELIRGSYPGVDMQGQLTVANIVRRKESALTAHAQLGVYAHGDNRVLPDILLQGSRRWDERLLEASLRGYRAADDDSGSGYRRQSDAAGNTLRESPFEFTAGERGSNLAVAYEQPAAGGAIRLNASVLAGRTDEKEFEGDSLLPGNVSVVTERKKSRQVELGMHYDRPIRGRSQLEMLVIQQWRGVDKSEREYEAGHSATFTTDSSAGESIARATVRTALTSGVTVEWGIEAAANFLDSESTNVENGTPVPLPASNVRVTERRAEPFGQFNWDLRPNLTLELGAAVELSRIAQQGDNSSARSLRYAKPRAALAWSPTPLDQLSVRIGRSVGQLDFDDFVSSTEFSTDDVNAGNPELEPSSAWEFTVSWERQMAGGATFVLTGTHSRISDVVEIVPVYADTDADGVPELFAGPGNAGAGRLREVRLGFNVPLDRYGIAGGLMKGDVTYRHTATVDALTGEERRISEVKQPFEGGFEFSQNFPARHFRWGMSVTLAESEPEFRLDERRMETERAWYGVFAEYYPSPDWSISLEAQNLSRRELAQERTLYDAPRDTGNVSGTDLRSRRFERYVYLQVGWHYN